MHCYQKQHAILKHKFHQEVLTTGSVDDWIVTSAAAVFVLGLAAPAGVPLMVAVLVSWPLVPAAASTGTVTVQLVAAATLPIVQVTSGVEAAAYVQSALTNAAGTTEQAVFGQQTAGWENYSCMSKNQPLACRNQSVDVKHALATPGACCSCSARHHCRSYSTKL